MTGLFLVATLLGVADPTAATEAVREAPAPATARAKAETTRYCVVGKITGSSIPRKTCNVRSEWLKQGFDPLAKR
jgi:hypothetical protein